MTWFDFVLSTLQYNDIAAFLTQLTANMSTHIPSGGKIHLTRVTTKSTTDFDEPDAKIYINNYHKTLSEDSTIGISHASRIEIISKWLKGEQRDLIAADLGLGQYLLWSLNGSHK